MQNMHLVFTRKLRVYFNELIDPKWLAAWRDGKRVQRRNYNENAFGAIRTDSLAVRAVHVYIIISYT